MKKILTVFMMIIALSASSQSKFKEVFLDNLYLGFGFDPRMALEGPGGNYENKPNTFHWHAEVGWDIEFDDDNGFRLSVGLNQHHEINYQEAVFKLDYKAVNMLFDRIDGYIGVRSSIIYRFDEYYPVNDPTLRRFKRSPESGSVGISGELKYEFNKWGIGARYDYFVAEGALIRDDKYFRDQGSIFLYKHF